MIYALDELRGQERIDTRDLIETGDDLNTYDYLSDEDKQLAEAIDALANEGIEDWEYGAHLIREDTFEDYARELAEDIGALDRKADWPLTYIDWPAAAQALAQDYATVTFLDHDYYVR